MGTVLLSATHVPLSRHNFLNLSYQKTVRKMKIMMTRKTIVDHSGVMTHQNIVIRTLLVMQKLHT